MQLTKNFQLDEFCVSSTADAKGISNAPTEEHRKRLAEVTAPGMQIVRDIFGRAVIITSAYRNPAVNRLVGGVPDSDHAEAWAVDFRVAGFSSYQVATILTKEMEKGGRLYKKVDQLILETSRSIVHISFAPRLRGQLLTQKRGPGTPFLKGIVG